MKIKCRIIQSGDKFIPQYKSFWWTCWPNYAEPFVTFSSLEEAESFARNKLTKSTCKVVKTFEV